MGDLEERDEASEKGEEVVLQKAKHPRSEKQKQQLIDARAKRDAAAKIKAEKIKEVRKKKPDEVLGVVAEPAPPAAELVVEPAPSPPVDVKPKREVKVREEPESDSDEEVVIIKKRKKVKKQKFIYLESDSEGDEPAPPPRRKVVEKREEYVVTAPLVPALRFI